MSEAVQRGSIVDREDVHLLDPDVWLLQLHYDHDEPWVQGSAVPTHPVLRAGQFKAKVALGTKRLLVVHVPPVKPLAVGDVIEDREDAERYPAGTIIRDDAGDVGRRDKAGREGWNLLDEGEDGAIDWPATVLYLPGADA